MSDQDGLYEGSPGGPDHKHPEVAPAEEFIFADEVQALHHIEKMREVIPSRPCDSTSYG
jgi:hypothetical protein